MANGSPSSTYTYRHSHMHAHCHVPFIWIPLSDPPSQVNEWMNEWISLPTKEHAKNAEYVLSFAFFVLSRWWRMFFLFSFWSRKRIPRIDMGQQNYKVLNPEYDSIIPIITNQLLTLVKNNSSVSGFKIHLHTFPISSLGFIWCSSKMDARPALSDDTRVLELFMLVGWTGYQTMAPLGDPLLSSILNCVISLSTLYLYLNSINKRIQAKAENV